MSEVRVREIKKRVCPAEFDTGSKGAKNLRAVRQARR